MSYSLVKTKNLAACLMMSSLFLSVLLLGAGIAHAALTVKVAEPKKVGKKVVIKLIMKNTFTERVESARAQVFLLDERGGVAGQAARWVIGGAKDKPALVSGAETTFNFVIVADKPFATNKVTFTRIILEGGKMANIATDVTFVPAASASK